MSRGLVLVVVHGDPPFRQHNVVTGAMPAQLPGLGTLTLPILLDLLCGINSVSIICGTTSKVVITFLLGQHDSLDLSGHHSLRGDSAHQPAALQPPQRGTFKSRLPGPELHQGKVTRVCHGGWIVPLDKSPARATSTSTGSGSGSSSSSSRLVTGLPKDTFQEPQVALHHVVSAPLDNKFVLYNCAMVSHGHVASRRTRDVSAS